MASGGGGEAARSLEIGSDQKLGGVGSRSAGGGGGGGQYFRADTLDFSKWDLHMGQTSSSSSAAVKSSTSTKASMMHEWEIDLSKLDMKHVLAHGTYGTVYRGVYAGQQVAVKVLDWGEDGQSTAAETTALRASFEQEVAVWQKLDHPNVTKFIGASMGTSDLKIPPANDSSGRGNGGAHPARACCVVVEYVAGGTLKKFLIKKYRSKLPIKDVIQLALDLARGLSYLHSKAIVHRDVKTENMLLETNKTLKIADFGVARVEAQNPQDMTGETGTLGYMAPEVLEGKPYNRKCDVYSFGVCLWEIYCCDMPYADCSFAEISHAVVHKNLRPEIPKCCPQSVANIMKRCWDPNPDKRPEMEEVVKLLEEVNTSKGGGMIPPDKFQGFLCFCKPRGP
ncbi:Protein kinase superfamily protein [Raphanus sativus]|uniref:non-specific serine/threonine protein kinase n=1 Tax=Raphanus sativus TaxID=3726 RepID=A0A6J0JD37_RAPSA|nr:serine/threonine-protein kinase STY13 [Raphanus sativus]KAJ4896469.1 Protein kinase superfamily protein [Raphanus sativus]